MRRLFPLSLLSLIFIFTGCIQPQKDLFPIPSADEILYRLTIHLDNGPSRVYAFTDKTGGFWQGQTFDYNSGAGYNISGEILLNDFLVIENDRFLDRRSAASAEILPYQVVHQLNRTTQEAITVLPGKHGLIISLSAADKSNFSWVPVFNKEKSKFKTEKGKNPQILFISTKTRKSITAVYTSSESNWVFPKEKPALDENLLKNKVVPATLNIKETKQADIIILFGDDKNQMEKDILEIAANASGLITQRKDEIGRKLRNSYFKTNLPNYDKAIKWAMISGNELVVDQFGKGIWAGLPWFNQNWGRDTFIALPGILLVTGQFDDAAKVIDVFTKYQLTDSTNNLFGRVPNRVISPDDIIYNTTDGTPWLIREIAEYAQYTGDPEFVRKMIPVVKMAIEGSVKNFVDSLGFLTHDDADTWMDARIAGKEAWSPRGNRAVDIQALWYNQLMVSANLAQFSGLRNEAKEWRYLAEKVKNNFNKIFVDQEKKVLIDHLNSDGSADLQVRPNQIFALTIPFDKNFIRTQIQHGVVRQVVSKLTYPYGVASLSQDDLYFHPKHHGQMYHFDAAYHNGLCWQWIAGPVISAMTQMGYKNLAFKLTTNLGDQVLNKGMPGSMSELVEPGLNENGDLVLSGTYSQAWSVSEFVRNFYQDYLGVKANLMNREIIFTPRLPDKITEARFLFNFGRNERLQVLYQVEGNRKEFTFYAKTLRKKTKLSLKLWDKDFHIVSASENINHGETVTMTLIDSENMLLKINENDITMERTGVSITPPSSDLKFREFSLNPDLQTLIIPDYLQNIILQKK